MYIDKLIEQLNKVKEEYGNMECVEETHDFLHNKIDSTIETVTVVDFLGWKAVKLDWRMD